MNTIESIVREAKQHNWPYPKRFAILKAAGALTHTVSFIDGFDSVYKSDQETWQEPAFPEYTVPVLANEFSQDGIKTALMERFQGKLSYMEFLAALASSGVSHYTADMTHNTVTYFNENEDKYFEQMIPVWKE